MMSALQLRRRLLFALGASGALLSACGEDTDESTGRHNDSPSPSESASATGGSGGQLGVEVTPPPTTGSGGSGATEPDPRDLTIRRPFLVGSGLRSAKASLRDDWLDPLAPPEPSIDESTRAALVASWQRDGLEEHASVAAFARFTLHLLAVGAPAELVARSQAAALDEVRHARACFSLARRYGGAACGPGPLSLEGALSVVTLAELVELMVEEGCVGETLGVLLAAEQYEGASDVTVRRILRRIAHDEARHAELAWAALRWALELGGEQVREVARAAFVRACGRAAELPVRPLAVDLGLWHAHGRLTCTQARSIVACGLATVVGPCRDALLASPAGASASISRARQQPLKLQFQ